jgi:hypothetical protein
MFGIYHKKLSVPLSDSLSAHYTTPALFETRLFDRGDVLVAVACAAVCLGACTAFFCQLLVCFVTGRPLWVESDTWCR